MAVLGLRLAMGIAILVALGSIVVRELDSSEFVSAFTTVSLPLLLLAAFAALSGSLLAVWRWKLLLSDAHLSIWRLYAVQYIGVAVGSVTSLRGVAFVWR